MAYSDMYETSRAVKDFSTAIEIRPNEAKFYFHRAMCYTVKGNNTKAIKDYAHAIALNSKYYEAYAARAHMYRVLKKNVQVCMRVGI